MLTRTIFIAIFGIVTGLLASLAAVVFVDAVGFLNEKLLISAHSRMIAADSAWLKPATVLVPMIGGLVVGLLCLLISERRPHGIPDAIKGAQTLRGRLPVKDGIVTAAAACVSLGSGASVGQYGPLAHLGATIGSWFGQFSGLGRYMGTIGIGCGVAAAIATAFNAPIAGVVFAHEVVLRHYSLRAFAPVTVAAAMGYLVVNHVFERPPLFRINPTANASTEEYLAFIVIGICGALLATVLMRMVLAMNRLAGSLTRIPAYTKPMIAGATLGIIALWLPDVLGVGKEVLRFAIIDDAFSAQELIVILSVKIFVTALCIGFGFAGGIFSPALLIGILFGALAGIGAELVLGDERAPIVMYAICGMVAVTSPIIGAPLTTILIVFELTRNYDLAIAAMVSVVFANLVGYRLFGRSLFDVQLANRGFDLSLGRDKVILDNRSIADYLTEDYVRIDHTDTLLSVKDKLISAGQSDAYWLDDDQSYKGTLALNQLLVLERDGADMERSAIAETVDDGLTLTKETSIWSAMQQMQGFVGERIPVVDNETDRRFVGVVFEASVVTAYLDTLHGIRREENAAI